MLSVRTWTLVIFYWILDIRPFLFSPPLQGESGGFQGGKMSRARNGFRQDKLNPVQDTAGFGASGKVVPIIASLAGALHQMPDLEIEFAVYSVFHCLYRAF